MNIGEYIKKYRKEKGLTQKQLAETIGVSTITIQNYENNRREPSLETLTKIGSALNVFFFKFDEEKNNNSSDYFLEQYLRTINCNFIYDEDGYIIFKTLEGEFEITESDIEEFNDSIKSFIRFKVSELIKKSRKIGK